MYFKISIFRENGESLFTFQNIHYFTNKKLQTIRQKYNYRIDIFLAETSSEIGPIMVYIPYELIQTIKVGDIANALKVMITITDIEIIITEITLKDYLNISRRDSSDVIMHLKLKLTFDMVFSQYAYQMIDEHIIDQFDCNQVDQILVDTTSSQEFLAEVQTIRSKRTSIVFIGHPLHYILETYSQVLKEIYIRILISELKNKNRLLSNRVITLTLANYFEQPKSWEDFFKEAVGCTMIISADPTKSIFSEDLIDYQLSKVLPLVEQYRHEVLVIFDTSNNKDFLEKLQSYSWKRLKLKYFKELEINTNHKMVSILQKLQDIEIKLQEDMTASKYEWIQKETDYEDDLNNLVEQMISLL